MSAAKSSRLRWDFEGQDWPNRPYSQFLTVGNLRWHVQRLGVGPTILLIHGTGASTHTWRDVLSPLAEHYSVVAIDLPGHGFTDPLPARQMTLPGISAALADLLLALKVDVSAVVGHSAGAAIAAWLCIEAVITPRILIGLNGVLLPPANMPLRAMSKIARLCATSPLFPRFFAWRAGDTSAVRRLVESTGSHLDARGYELYARLTRSPSHVDAVLQMLAGWDLTSLERKLDKLSIQMTIIVADGDRAVSPCEGQRLADRLVNAKVIHVMDLGHLAHEEDPNQLVNLIRAEIR